MSSKKKVVELNYVRETVKKKVVKAGLFLQSVKSLKGQKTRKCAQKIVTLSRRSCIVTSDIIVTSSPQDLSLD